MMEKVTTKRMSLFTGRTHPALAEEVAEHLGIELGQGFLFHPLDSLRWIKTPYEISRLRRAGRIRRGTQSLLVGFGVGFSWAGCLWKDQYAPA